MLVKNQTNKNQKNPPEFIPHICASLCNQPFSSTLSIQRWTWMAQDGWKDGRKLGFQFVIGFQWVISGVFLGVK